MNSDIPPTSKTILVTGGGGFLGKAIVRQLVDKGHRVSSFSRGTYPDLEAMGVHQHTGDIADAEAVRKAAKGADVVFHVAAFLTASASAISPVCWWTPMASRSQ